MTSFFGFWIELADGQEGGHDGLFMILSDCPVIMWNSTDVVLLLYHRKRNKKQDWRKCW